jgi:hypothetical protein
MFGVAVARENDHFMATVLQPHCRINDQSFCAANAQVGMEEGYVLLLLSFFRHNATSGWGWTLERDCLVLTSVLSREKNLEASRRLCVASSFPCEFVFFQPCSGSDIV